MSAMDSKSPSELIEGFDKVLSVFLSEEERKEFITVISPDTYKKLSEGKAFNFPEKTRLPEESFFNDVVRVHLDRIVSYAQQKLDNQKYLSLLIELGELSISTGEFQLALELFDQIVDSSKKEKEFDNTYAYALFSTANIHSRQAQWYHAKKYIKRASMVFTRNNDSVGLAKCENLLGTIFAEQGKTRFAMNHFEKGLSYLDPQLQKSHTAMFEVNLGITHSISGNVDESLAHFQRALIKYEELNDFRHIAEVRHNMGMLYLKKNQFDSAQAEFEISIEISLNHRYLPILVISYLSTGETYIRLGDNDLASAYVDRGFEIGYQVNDKLSLAEGYKLKGIIARNNNNYEACENNLLTSYRMNKLLDNDLNAAEAAVELGILYKTTGNNDKAGQYFDEASSYYNKIRNNDEIKKIKSLKNN